MRDGDRFFRISAFSSIPRSGNLKSEYGRSSTEGHGGGGNPETASNPASLRTSSASMSTVRWIVYKGSGGLAHMLGGLSDAIKIAKRTRRHLVIDCRSAGAFQSSFDKYFYIEDEALSYSCSYEQIPDAAVHRSGSVEALKEVPVVWRKGDRYFLNDEDVTIVSDRLGRPSIAGSEADVVFCGGPGVGMFGEKPSLHTRLAALILTGGSVDTAKWNQDLMLQSTFVKQIKQDFRIEGDYIGLHFRNTDIENDISSYLPRLRAAIQKYSINRLAIATDDYKARSVFASALPEVDVVQLTSPGSFEGKNIHYHSEDKSKQIYECLLDIYMLVNSSVLVPSMNSGLSRWVVQMVEDRRNLFGVNSKVREVLV